MDVHVKAQKPLARRCRCGMTFDAGGCLMQVTPEEYAALKADPWLDVAIMDPEDLELSPDPQPSPAVSAQAAAPALASGVAESAHA
ncbi:hypothetical protein [Desulfovibrio piger]